MYIYIRVSVCFFQLCVFVFTVVYFKVQCILIHVYTDTHIYVCILNDRCEGNSQREYPTSAWPLLTYEFQFHDYALVLHYVYH